VFQSHGNPDASEPYMTLSHHVTPTLGPVLKKLGNQYSPVSSKSLIKINIWWISLIWDFSEKNQWIFVYEDDLWAVKGRYNTAVVDDDSAEWKVINNQFRLRLLIVRFYS
jgi:hypothetical protein